MKWFGLDLTSPINRLRAGFVSVAQNVRCYAKSAFQVRNSISPPILTVTGGAINTILRLNDTTPQGPLAGYTYIISDDEGNLYCGSSGILSPIAVGMTPNPKSMVPFRPNASVQPWMYCADSAPDSSVTIFTRYALSDSSVSFLCSGMVKVRSDGLIYKMGIKEPQTAPMVSTASSTATGSLTVEGTQEPYTNAGGLNGTWPFGGTQPQASMTTIPVSEGQTVTITGVTGTVVVGGIPHNFNDPVANTININPGYWVFPSTGAPSSPLLMVAFTNGSGQIQTPSASPSEGYIYGIDSIGLVLNVPQGATQLQFGINTPNSNIGTNTGSFDVSYSIETSNVADHLAILNQLTVYYWGDSPSSGPVAQYIWHNPNSTGSGPARASNTAVGTTSGNSFIFDATITAGVPSLPGIDITNSTDPTQSPMAWSQLDTTGTITGSIPAFSPAIKNPSTGLTRYSDFNFCLAGYLWVPQAGNYTLVLTNKDNCLLGIGGGASFVSGIGNWWGANESVIQQTRALTLADLAAYGQTVSVVSGLPLMPVAPLQAPGGQFYDEGGACTQSVLTINFPSQGTYAIELDYDYWFHSGRILLLQGSPVPGGVPAIIPPIPATATIDNSFLYVYRSSLTGAQSNPSPPSTPITSPSTGAVVGSDWSPDPQVDKVDYYEQNSELENFTYVGTGRNDGWATGQNTPIESNVTAAEVASNPTVEFDNFEPFPSIDTPKSGTCSVTGGVITRLTGDPFNIRWLPGTVIEIGLPPQNPEPPQIAYTFISRPTDPNHIILPGVQAGDNLEWNIAEPILAAQPIPYLFGPTDNINYAYALGDPLRPGTAYWCKGSNLDAAPDTNQADVTDPSEALVNGAMTGGLAVIGSIRRHWIIEPNFYNAEATSEGTIGNIFSFQATEIPRGLYMPRCIAVEGGGRVFIRVQDGIIVSASGGPSKSITDETLYPIFPHEGSTPKPITRNGVTIWPPDDTKPQLQQFNIQGNYLYYDYAFFGANVPVIESTNFTPATATSEGEGIPWNNPAGVNASGIGANQVVQITGFSISGDMVTFDTVTQQDSLVAGQDVVISNLSTGTYLNGHTLTVESPTSNSFQAVFTHADVASTFDIGLATPTTQYAYAFNGGYVPPMGQNSVLALPSGVQASPEEASGNCFGPGVASPWAFVAGNGYGAGVNGCPLGASPVAWESTDVAIPNLPPGAAVTSIIPVAIGTHLGGTGTAQFSIIWPSGSFIFPLNGTLQQTTSLGTDLSVLSGTKFRVDVSNSLDQPPNMAVEFNCQMSFYGVMVNYTAPGQPITSTQLQTLKARNLGLAIPPDSGVTGIVVNLQAGMAYGSSATLDVQLTLNGNPVGTPRTISVGPWATEYSLGGDIWRIGGLSGSDVNGVNGLGVNIYGTLPANAQVNVNDLNGEVFYAVDRAVEGSTTLVFDIENDAWVMDSYPEVDSSVLTHSANQGYGVQGVLLGADSSAYSFVSADSTSDSNVAQMNLVTGAVGGVGYQHLRAVTLEYAAQGYTQLSFAAVDEGNGSYAPHPIFLPGTGGVITKQRFPVTPAKWKLMTMEFETGVDSSLVVNLDGVALQIRDWGSPEGYKVIQPFAPNVGGLGSQ